jgi:hypothetical protein
LTSPSRDGQRSQNNTSRRLIETVELRSIVYFRLLLTGTAPPAVAERCNPSNGFLPFEIIVIPPCVPLA